MAYSKEVVEEAIHKAIESYDPMMGHNGPPRP